MIRSINYVRFLFPSRNWQCSWFWHFFFKQLLQMILAENDISQFRPDLVWKTQFVFMGVVTGNPFVSCPQLRAISASSTVYKVINQAMICTHKRNCTPARLFILCRLQNIRRLSKLTFPEKISACSPTQHVVFTQGCKKSGVYYFLFFFFLQIHDFPIFPKSSLCCELGT